MNNAKLKSTEVQVFPSAYRGYVNVSGESGETLTKSYNPESRLNTEFNITNIINRLASRDSFILDYDSTTKVMICSIHGYWFKLDLSSIYSSLSGNAIYAYIKIAPRNTGYSDPDNIDYAAESLASFDPNVVTALDSSSDPLTSEFVGLIITDNANMTDVDGEDLYKLKLFTNAGGLYFIPPESYLIFKSSKIEDKNTGSSLSAQLTTEVVTASTRVSTPTVEATTKADAAKIKIGSGKYITDISYSDNKLSITFED